MGEVQSRKTQIKVKQYPHVTFFFSGHHRHYTALPTWVQNLGMTFSVMLLVPSWASAGDALAKH